MVDSIKYGKPTVESNSTAIRRVGASTPTGFHAIDGRMCKNAKDTTSNITCRMACQRVGNFAVSTCEYA